MSARWLTQTLDELRKALEKQDISRYSGRLLNSLAAELVHSGQGVDEVIVKFLQYGRFVDMGVGRGFQRGSKTSLGDEAFFKKRNLLGQLKVINRKPKPWFSKTKTREVARLRELLLRHQESLVLNEVEKSLKGD